jgi:hypothetical protein
VKTKIAAAVRRSPAPGVRRLRRRATTAAALLPVVRRGWKTRVMPQPGGVCVLCGQSLEDRHANAMTCSPACRRERDRLLAILRREEGAQYASLHARVVAAQRRANGARRGVLWLGSMVSRAAGPSAR